MIYDYRIVAGREAVRCLVALKELLEAPARLLLQGPVPAAERGLRPSLPTRLRARRLQGPLVGRRPRHPRQNQILDLEQPPAARDPILCCQTVCQAW